MNTKIETSLSLELKSLVRHSVSLLGEVIKEEGGKELFDIVEEIRQEMIEYRVLRDSEKIECLKNLYRDMEKYPVHLRHQIANSYTLMLELINTCEAAYRTFKLREQKIGPPKQRQNNRMIYVLTAHPTEARSPENIELFRRIQSVQIRILDGTGEEDYMKSIIKHNLKLAWLLPVTRHEKPTVIDEAKHLFSIICRDDIFDTILRADRDYGAVRIRTWVGGDKDGHPGVDEKVLLASLQASRDHFMRIGSRILADILKDLNFLQQEKILKSFKQAEQAFQKCKTVKSGDNANISKFKQLFDLFASNYVHLIGEESPRIRKFKAIFDLFPALVIPLELREDSELLHQTYKNKENTAIARMLEKLAAISKGGDITGYAKGMIISMCHSVEDVLVTKKLVRKIFNHNKLPIVPLFETAKALEDSPTIVTKLIKEKSFFNCINNGWKGQFEIMLGYSDSSKGMGVLPSRLAIAKTIRSLDVILSKANIIPIFFHGSGGSIDRGGGSLRDQTLWWPKSALNVYKATIQGEMVERNFTSPEVSISGINKILDNFNRAKTKKGTIKVDKAVESFSASVKLEYENKIKDPKFFEMIEAATPYSYLNVLRLGSRPTKRAKASKLDLSSIRAIPWILCWTQTRVLFPTWWGVGSSWEKIKDKKDMKTKLKLAFKESSLFGSYIRALSFTLSKVDINVFALYLSTSTLSIEDQNNFLEEFRIEYESTVQFVRMITGKKNLLWYRPWLADSIELRSSMIHPLNILQILAYKDKDNTLIRKTVAGISSGMMTTG